MEKRVVVTGLGAVTPVGNDVNTFWESLKAGRCGISRITGFPVDELPVKIAGQIHDFDPMSSGVDKPFSRKQDPFAVYALASAWQAMTDSGLDTQDNIDPYRLGVYFSSGVGGFETIGREFGHLAEDSSGKWVSPLFIPNMIENIAAGHIAMKFGAYGSCISIVTACATSTHTIGEAYRAIKHGYADAIISGGSEHGVVPLGVAGFAAARALTREEDPTCACRPFSADRSGFVMADGAACLILEEYEHAVARGAHIYAEMVGYGSTCDAYHQTAPRPDGSTQSRCIIDALNEAQYDADRDSVYVNAHGTSTHLNDSMETNAYKLAFGESTAHTLHISSTKSMHGHMFGATGAAEAIATILALRDGIVPPTINLRVPDPECDLDYTPGSAINADLTLGLSDSFGFGGHNACVAFRKTESF